MAKDLKFLRFPKAPSSKTQDQETSSQSRGIRAGTADEFFTASSASGMTQKQSEGLATLDRPQASQVKPGVLRIPKPSKSKTPPKERDVDKAPGRQAVQTFLGDKAFGQEVVAQVDVSSPRPSSRDFFSAESRPVAPFASTATSEKTVSQEFFTARSHVSVTQSQSLEETATLSHPRPSEAKPGLQPAGLRIPKASKNRTPPKGRVKTRTWQTSQEAQQGLEAMEAPHLQPKTDGLQPWQTSQEAQQGLEAMEAPHLQPKSDGLQPWQTSQEAQQGLGAMEAPHLQPKTDGLQPWQTSQEAQQSLEAMEAPHLQLKSDGLQPWQTSQEAQQGLEAMETPHLQPKSESSVVRTEMQLAESPKEAKDLTDLSDLTLTRAAIRLQALYRGKRARDARAKESSNAVVYAKVEVPELNNTGNMVSHEHAVEQTAKQFPPAGEHEKSSASPTLAAAVKIQAFHRGRLARKGIQKIPKSFDSQGDTPNLASSQSEDAVVRMQALYRGWQVRKGHQGHSSALSIGQVGMLRIKAVRTHKASKFQVRGSFLEDNAMLLPSNHEATSQAAVRLQAAFRGNRVRQRLKEERWAARKIQKSWSGWTKLKKARMKIASVAVLRVQVHNFHQADTATKEHIQVDKSFLDTEEVRQGLSDYEAATKIQACFRGKKGRAIAAREETLRHQTSANMSIMPTMPGLASSVSLGPSAMDAVRRSLLAGSAVVDEGIAKIYRRASDTFEEALAASDRAAQRASVVIGESLLQMVIDTSSPVSPREKHAAGHAESHADTSGDKELNRQKEAIADIVQSIDATSAKLEAWLQRRARQQPVATNNETRGENAVWPPLHLSELMQKRRRDLTEQGYEVG
ncbi:unnamed protein product [Durusdinium trenchii]|uniref:Uncharacterized protein n=2 Tax=Durusdinium trenchii TaxID=1381693 RepID=A0ABP0KY11_9DINO